MKTRRKLPQWLRAAVEQAQRNADDGGVPLVVLHETGRRHDNDVVLMRLADFERWFGDS